MVIEMKNFMPDDIIKIRMAAYKILHLVFVKYTGPGMYRIVSSEIEGGVPKLTDNISFQPHESRIRVKDIGSNIIYLLNPKQFRESLLETMLKKDPGLEDKIRVWFPLLWGDITAEDRIRYQTILRQLKEIADLYEFPDHEK
jgi:hypothetical protein